MMIRDGPHLSLNTLLKVGQKKYGSACYHDIVKLNENITGNTRLRIDLPCIPCIPRLLCIPYIPISTQTVIFTWFLIKQMISALIDSIKLFASITLTKYIHMQGNSQPKL